MQYYKEKINDLKQVVDMMMSINEELCMKADSMQNEYRIKEENLQKRINALEQEKSELLTRIQETFESFSKCIDDIKTEIGKVTKQEERNEYFLEERIDFLNTKIMEIHQKVIPLFPENESEDSSDEARSEQNESQEESDDLNSNTSETDCTEDIWGLDN